MFEVKTETEAEPFPHPAKTGRGIVVVHLPWEQADAGSNPAAQTILQSKHQFKAYASLNRQGWTMA